MSKRKRVWILYEGSLGGDFYISKDPNTPLCKLKTLEQFVGAYYKPADALPIIESKIRKLIKLKQENMTWFNVSVDFMKTTLTTRTIIP